MEAVALQLKLENQPDKIQMILESLGFHDLKFNPVKNNFRFAREENRNPSSCVLDCSTLCYFIFSMNKRGNLFSLIMDVRQCSFPQSLRYAAVKAGLSMVELNKKTRLPFDGFWTKLEPNKQEDIPLESYPESKLDAYYGKYNMRFLRDGISFNTQEKFGVGYDFESNRITIPERGTDGALVGIMGRANYDCPHEERWRPIIPCSRSKTLYGYTDNYKRIQETGTIVLFESEKAVQQCDSFGCNIALATCGCHISDTQARHIKRLYPKQIILAYDEGLTEEHLREECEKVKSNNAILKTKVGYIFDEASVIPEGSKMNLADLGKDAYVEGVGKYVKWLEN